MSLINQFDKFVVTAKRETTFVPSDSKDGKPQKYSYLSGFNAVDGSCLSDVPIADDSLIDFDRTTENTVYDCVFNKTIIKGEKNATRTTSVKLVSRVGTLEVKFETKKA